VATIRRMGLARHSASLAVAVAWLVAMASSVVRAQQPDTSLPSNHVARALPGLERGQRVRIRVNGDGLKEGVVLGSSERLVTIRRAGAATAIPAAGVDSLWVRGTHAGRGALIGGAVLGLGFGALGATVCPSECDVSSATGFERGGLIGFVLGGAIGAIVGLTVHSWRLRVP